jgi:hypothetical protein
MNIARRFAATYQPVGGWDESDSHSPYEGIVTDCGEIIWRSEPMSPSEELPQYSLSDYLRPQAEEWLLNHYPDWEDPLAYWD